MSKIRIIGGSLRRREIKVPEHIGLRPTIDRVRETLFNWLGQHLEGYICLDACAGSGVLGFEACSRGARKVYMFEKNRQVAQVLKATARQLNIPNEQLTIMHGDVLHDKYILNTGQILFNLVFLDPPYDLNMLPDLIRKVSTCIALGGFIYMEYPKNKGPRISDYSSEWIVYREGKLSHIEYVLWQRQS
jgi:16S rRNA (guanine966-N2)-methyltransferase